jgi:hypothetical protein
MRILVKSHKRKGRVVRSHARKAKVNPAGPSNKHYDMEELRALAAARYAKEEKNRAAQEKRRKTLDAKKK